MNYGMNYACRDDITSSFYSEELHLRNKNERRASQKIYTLLRYRVMSIRVSKRSDRFSSLE